MSTHDVDKRVVQMEFDNRQFEQGVSQTMSTLDKLKQSLHLDDSGKAFSGIEKAAKSVDLTGLYSNIESLSDRFSTFGIIGMTIIQRITNAVMDLGHKLVSMISTPLNQIKTGGWNRALNIEKSMFTMRGLLDDFEAQQDRIKENIDWAVSGTAFSYDAAAMAMSQLVASGVEFREGSDDMKEALRGISGVAAQTNSDYSEIANIFTSIAGNGRLMGQQLTQLSVRGFNAAAVLGKSLGKTEKEIRDMTSKGQISFQQFAHAMDTAFGEHAKKANDTFTGALSNIKAALSRTGQGFGESLQHYGRDILNAIRPNINKFNKTYLQPLVDSFDAVMSRIAGKARDIFGNGEEGKLYMVWIPSALRSIGNIGLGILGIMKQIKNAFEAVFPLPTRAAVLRFWNNVEDATKKFRNAFSEAKTFVEAFKEKVDEATAPVQKTVETIKDLEEITARVIRGDFGNGQTRFDQLEKLGYNWKEVQNAVNEALGNSFRYDVEQNEILATGKKIAEQKAKELSLGKKLDVIALQQETYDQNHMEAAYEAYKQKQAELAVIEQRNTRLQNIQSTFKGIAAAIKIVGQAAAAAKKVIVDPFLTTTLPKLLETVFEYTGSLGEKVFELSKWLDETGWFETFFQGIVQAVSDFVRLIGQGVNAIKEFGLWIYHLEPVQFIVGKIAGFFKNLPASIDNTKQKFKELGDTLKSLPGVNSFLTTVKNLSGQFKTFAEGKISAATKAIKDFNAAGYGAMIAGGLLWVVDKIATGLKTVIDNLRKAYKAVKDFLGPFGASAKNRIIAFFDSFKNGLNFSDFDKKLEEKGGIFNAIKNFGKKVTNFFEEIFNKIPWGNFGSIFRKGMAVAGLFLFGKLLGKIFGLIDAKKGVLTTITSVISKVGNVFDEYVFSMRAESLKVIAEAIAIFVGSIVLLALVPSDKLISVAAAIAAVVYAITLLVKAVGKIRGPAFAGTITTVSDAIKFWVSKFASIASISLVALGVAGSIFLLTLSIKKIMDILGSDQASKFKEAVKILGKTFMSLVIAIAVLQALVQVLRYFGSSIDEVGMIGIGAALLGLGAAMLLISLAINKLRNVPWASLKNVGLMLAALSIGMAAIMWAAGKGGKGAAATVFAIALALSALVVPLLAISKIYHSEGGEKALAWATGLIVAVGLTAAVVIATLNDVKPLQLLTLAGSLVVLSAGIVALAGALYIFSKTDLSSDKIKQFGILVGVLTALSGILALISRFFISDSTAKKMFQMATSFAAIGVGILAFSAAIYVLGKALPVFANGLADLVVVIHERGSEILEGLIWLAGTLAIAFAAGIIASKIHIAKGASEFITALVEGLSKAWPTVLNFIRNHGVITIVTLGSVLLAAMAALVPSLVDGIINVLNVLADQLHQKSDAIASAFIRVLYAILEIVVQAFFKAVRAVFGPIIDMFNWIADYLGNSELHIDASPVADFASNTVNEMNGAYDRIDEAFAEGDKGMYEGAAGNAEAARKGFKDHFKLGESTSEELAETSAIIEEEGSGIVNSTAAVGDEASSAMEEHLDLSNGISLSFEQAKSFISIMGVEIPDSITNLTELINYAMANGLNLTEIFGGEVSLIPGVLNDNAGETQEAVQDFTDTAFDINTDSAEKLMNRYGKTIEESDAPQVAIRKQADAIDQELSLLGDGARDTGATITTELAGGMSSSESLNSVGVAATDVRDTAVKTVDEGISTIKKSGKSFTRGYATGISSLTSMARMAASRIKDSANSGVSGSYDAGKREGGNFGSGYVDGISSYLDRAFNKAKRLAEEAIAGVKKGQESQSPSKKARKLGQYFSEGYALGIDDLSGKVNTIAGDLSNEALDTMRGTIEKLAAIMTEDMDASPMIRPVVDLSAVEEGAEAINGMFDKFVPVSALNGTAKIGSRFGRANSDIINNDKSGTVNGGNSYTFTQNNYSPKALSRLEIYRQTKNQFAQMKGLANA